MCRHVPIGSVDRRIVKACFDNSGLEIVRDHLRRHAAKEVEGSNVAADPVWQALCPGCFNIGEVRCPKGRDKDLSRPHLARLWVNDINETQNTTVDFPVLADSDHTVSDLYDMIHPNANDTLTVRSVFFIDPRKKIRATITYPASTGRNFNEILRVIDSLQLTDSYSVATLANWNVGDDVIIVPSLQDPEVLKQKFPKGYTVVKPYLRITPQPDLKLNPAQGTK